MTRLSICLLTLLIITGNSFSQEVPSDSSNVKPQVPTVTDKKKTAEPADVNPTDKKLPDSPATMADVDKIQKQLDAADKHPDFELSLGIGSLIDYEGASDYKDQTNILSSTNLGRATPQYLVGVSFRTPYPSFGKIGHSKTECLKKRPADADARGPYIGDPACDYWKVNPWKAFLSLKFSSGSSQTLSGFVLGGSYQFAHYIDGLVGFGFTPFNEASPGLRVAASQFVTSQQKLGNLLNFDPAAMLAGQKNAFDGFSLVDTSGKLIYSGDALETHYRGGVVFGVAIPISLTSVFNSKTQ